MDDITASIIVACQTDGATAAVNKLGFSFAMLGRQALDFGVKAVQEFRVTQDASWKFGKTFKDSMGTAENAVREFMEEYNLAESTSRSMLTDTAQILKGMGFAERESLNVAASISRWGVDLASFTGYAGGAQGAVQAIIASMMGENERLKSIGVVIREDSDEFRDMAKEIMKTKNVSEQHAKALAKLELITRKAADAKGDYAAEGENFTQTVNNLNQQIKQTTSNIGEMIYESLRLNNVFSTISDGLKENSTAWKREKETWIFAIRTFVNGVVAAFKVVALPFDFIGVMAKDAFSNVLSIGGWFYDNWGKLWRNALEVVKAVFLDVWEYIQWFWGPDGMVTGFFVTAGKAIWDAIKTGMKGGDVGKVFKDAFAGYLDKNVIGGFAKQGQNLDKAIGEAGISAIDLKFGVKDFNFSTEFEKIMQEYERAQAYEEVRHGSRTAAKHNKRTAQTQEASAAFGPAILGDLTKQLFTYRSMAQSAIDANSLEGWRLQTRRMANVDITDPQKSSAESLKTVVKQGAETNQKLENLSRQVATLVSGGAKVTVAARKY